jgi:hypothetical protein
MHFSVQRRVDIALFSNTFDDLKVHVDSSHICMAKYSYYSEVMRDVSTWHRITRIKLKQK